jgi:NAD(P)-dependent dehydrogenase (short-subunit alcohol dehydrogenase family)
MTYSRDRRYEYHDYQPHPLRVLYMHQSPTMKGSTPIAVIFGAGPGLAASLARALAPTHALMLLSRSLPGSLPKLDLDIPEDRLLALRSDGSQATLQEAFKEMEKKWPGHSVEVGVFNAGGNFNPGSFLDKTEKDFRDNLESFA